MAYCRWSTDDYQCDLYVYADVSGGYTIHVAGGRYLFKEPLPPPVSFMTDIPEWVERHNKVMAMCEAADQEKIDLAYAGDSFYGYSAEQAVDTLRMLHGLGYRFPCDEVTEAIQEDGDNEPEEEDGTA